jgi:hypothetical protein
MKTQQIRVGNKRVIETSKKDEQYIEVLGDTAKPNSLIYSVLIGLLCSFGFFFLGQYLFPLFVEDKMVASYSLFLGIAGTVISLVVNSIIFKPSRLLTEALTTTEGYNEVLKELNLDVEEEYEVYKNDPATRREMEEFGIKLDHPLKGGK